MRTTIAAIILLLASGAPMRSGAAQARDLPPNLARAGVIGGASFSTFVGPDASWAGMRTGAFAGLVAAFPLGRLVFLEPRLEFATRGTTADSAGLHGTLRLDYASAALLLGLRLPLTVGPVHPVVLAGPTLSFPTECLSAPLGGSWCDYHGRQFQLGASAGAGIVASVGVVTLDVTALYRRGFVRVISVERYHDAGLDLGAALMVPLPWGY